MKVHEILEATFTNIPAVRDRIKGDELNPDPKTYHKDSPGWKRTGQKAGRKLKRKYGIGHDRPNAKQPGEK